jgi:hypothetical protein
LVAGAALTGAAVDEGEAEAVALALGDAAVNGFGDIGSMIGATNVTCGEGAGEADGLSPGDIVVLGLPKGANDGEAADVLVPLFLMNRNQARTTTTTTTPAAIRRFRSRVDMHQPPAAVEGWAVVKVSPVIVAV